MSGESQSMTTRSADRGRRKEPGQEHFGTPLCLMIVDDQEAARNGLRDALSIQPDVGAVVETDNGLDAVQLAARHRPDVVLTEVRLPKCDGIELTRRLLAAPLHFRPHVIILTSFGSRQYLFQALEAGASGFLLKSTTMSYLLQAIQTVIDGDAVVCPPMTRHLIDHLRDHPPLDASGGYPGLGELTGRELDVLGGIASGKSNHEIARDLGLTTATVKSYVSSLLTKLGLRDRVQAALLGYQAGLAKARDRRVPGELGPGARPPLPAVGHPPRIRLKDRQSSIAGRGVTPPSGG
jgi:DNA-binding NarL/FixJ family response regulator